LAFDTVSGYARSSMLIASATTETIGAVVGVVGMIVGVAGFLSAMHARRDAAHDREEAERLREQAQAEKVNAWAEKRTAEGRLVVARNTSDQPVRDVKIWLVTPDTPAPFGAVPDRDPATRRAVLEPNDTLEHLIRTTRPAPAERPPVFLTFTDAEGRRWLRNADGRLTRRDA
jgi:hypothetical protein